MNPLNPKVYPSNGLMQAHFDAFGGGWLETTVGGDTQPFITVVAGQQITIPAANGGGAVSWIRAVWDSAVTMRWNGFMSDLASGEALPAAANLLASKQSDINSWSYGSGAKFDVTTLAGVIQTVVGHGALVGSSWDISTGTYAGKTVSLAAQDTSPQGLAFSPDGLQMYVVGATNKTVYQYTLTMAWDLSTAAYAGKSLNCGAQDLLVYGITFSVDGTKMYVSGQTNSSIYEYVLTTAWDISTGAYAAKVLAVGAQATKPRGIAFDPTGTTLMIADYSSDTIYQYTLTTAWDVSTGAYSTKSLWTAGATDTPGWLAFKPDGTTLYFTGAFNHKGILYEYGLTTAWDISAGAYSAKSLNVTAQDTVPNGLFMKADGMAFYLAGQTGDAAYEYSVGVSSGAYATGAGYAVGNVVPINGGNNDAHVTVTAVDASGAITGVGSIVGGTGYVDASGLTSQIAVNLVSGTRITLAVPVADGTSVQVFYTYRNGTKTTKGAALGGWPNLHTSEVALDYGTANDGDNYLAHAAYYGYKALGMTELKALGDRILAAQLAFGSSVGQHYAFDMPLQAEQANGLYYYNSSAPWFWDVSPLPDGSGLRGLNIHTLIAAGGPPYANAGWGSWVTWPIAATTPFTSISFDFYGDGTTNQIGLKTNIHSPSDAAGEYRFGFACLPADRNVKRTITVAQADFWQLNNVILNADRSSTFSGVYSNDNAATLTPVPKDNVGASGYHRFIAQRLTYYLATETYAGCYFGSKNANFSSAGTTNLKMDLESSAAGNITVTITDANNAQYPYVYAAAIGQQLFDVPYTAFTGGAGIVHPIKQVALQPGMAVNGTLDIDNIRCAGATDIVTMATANPTMLNGWEFDPVLGSYNVFFKNVTINQAAIDPYPLLSRWTYTFNKVQGGKYYGQGSYRGAQAPGYMWIGGYALADLRYPAGTIARYANGTTYDYSGQPVANCMRKFMQDAQNAYAAQYPAQMIGPVMKKYGAWGWEHVQGAGYIGGVAVPNVTYPQGVLNQFFCEGADDWYGYQYRAFLSVAEDYFYTGDAISLAVLNNWIAWMAAKCTWNAATHAVTAPTTFNVDGTLANSANVYADACMAQACILKYWRDGDATAFTWLSRFLDDLHYNHKQTSTGALEGIFPQAFGSGYTVAAVNFTVNAGATAPTAEAVISGGRVTSYRILTYGANITSISATVTGDGAGAQAAPWLNDRLKGAYNPQHTGWEIAEIAKALGMLVNGRSAFGNVNHPIEAPSYLVQDYDDLWKFYDANTGDARPSILNADYTPMHEFTWSSWHTGVGVENPVNYDTTANGSRDTHTDGDSWTETLGPSLFCAIDRYMYSGSRVWLARMMSLLTAMAGTLPASLVWLPTPARLAAQAKHERFNAVVMELDLDFCNNTFGVLPCTATGTPCYNTYGTCKDKPNYSKGVKTRKFCLRGMPAPVGETIRPYILSHTFTPTQIPLSGGLGSRSQTTLVMADEVCADFEDDPYAAQRAAPAQGTYWTRLQARNYNYAGRLARIRRGYIQEPFTWATFQDELFVVESIVGPDENNQVQITLSDVIKPIDKQQVPPPTSGKLIADIKAVEYSGQPVDATTGTMQLAPDASAVDGYYVGMEVYVSALTGAGQRRKVTAYVGATRVATLDAAWAVVPDIHSTVQIGGLSITVDAGAGSQYNDPAVTGRPEFVRIGDEDIRYTAISGDVLSWPDTSYRAQFGTAAQDHKANDGVQLCFAAVKEAYSSVVQRLFNDGGVVDDYLDLTGLVNEDATWLSTGMLITACISVPTKGSELINQVLLVGMMQSWWDAVSQLQRFKIDMPQLSTTVPAITHEEILQGTLRKEPLDSQRITSFALVYGPVSSTANMAELKNYLIPDVEADVGASSAVEYGSIIMQKLFSQWLTVQNSSYAHSFVVRRVNRFRDAPFKLTFSLDPRNEVRSIANLLDITTRRHTDQTGAPLTVRMRVTKITPGANQALETISTPFWKRYAFIAWNDYPVYGVASADQRARAFISSNAGLMSDGSSAYLIS